MIGARKSFVIETDSQVAVNMIMQPETDRSPTAAILGEIKSLLKQGREYSVVHVNRSCNNVAHRLAQIGHHHVRTAVWLRSGPNEIELVHRYDCSPRG